MFSGKTSFSLNTYASTTYPPNTKHIKLSNPEDDNKKIFTSLDVAKRCCDPREEFVTFTFPKDQIGIRFLKSILTESSDVFKTMFEADKFIEGKSNTVFIDTDTFDGETAIEDVFKTFLTSIYDTKSIVWNILLAMNVYVLSHHYQIESQMPEIISIIDQKLRLNQDQQFIIPKYFKLFLKFVKTYDLKHLESRFGGIKLSICKDNYLEYYHILKEYDQHSLMEQIVDYLMEQNQPEESWPVELYQKMFLKFKQRIPRNSNYGYSY